MYVHELNMIEVGLVGISSTISFQVNCEETWLRHDRNKICGDYNLQDLVKSIVMRPSFTY